MNLREKIRELSKSADEWLKVSKEREYLVLGSFVIGVTIIVMNFLLFQGVVQVFTTINILGASLIVGPATIAKYVEYKKSRKIESMFPNFLSDVVSGTQSGMTLTQSIKAASKNEYGPLSPYVKKMASQIDWGIPFDQVLKGIAKELRSKLIDRTVSTIIETHRSGGSISDVLESVSTSVTEVERIKEERKAHVYSQILTGYVIYFVFLGVIIGLQKFLIPTLSFTGVSQFGVPSTKESTGNYNTVFQNLIVIQGLFSGLAIGKMSEGSIMAGLKHVIVFIAIGLTAFVLIL
ncbi:MAG: type II secretion system F family protein [Candidatus Aenigmarchaeota archaeon]|nr:type II secretion system F family protein [Candidatus Aenigmarchaeota archaeon]